MKWTQQAAVAENLANKVQCQRRWGPLLAEMKGHAGIQTTQRYIDVNDEQMRRAAELI